MYNDAEITAMSKVLEAFISLRNDQRRRIIEWITSKFGLHVYDRQPVAVPMVGVDRKPAAYTEPVPAVEPLSGDEQPISEEAEEEEVEEPVSMEESTPAPGETDETDKKAVPLKGLGLKRYRSIETLFLSSNVKTIVSKILLAAAYLQEKLDFNEISGFDVNSRLKKMGYGVPNISTAMNPLLKKDPPLLIQVRKDGGHKQSKRKFRVTEEGLNLARTYLRGKEKGE